MRQQLHFSRTGLFMLLTATQWGVSFSCPYHIQH